MTPFPARAASPCVFEYVYFARPDSIMHGRSIYETRQRFGRVLAREQPVEADLICPVPDGGNPAALGYSEALRHPVRLRHHPQPLCRSHLHPADADRPPALHLAQARRQQADPRRQARGAGRRLDRARQHLAEDRADGARRRRGRNPFPRRLPADQAPGLLRHRHAIQGRADRLLDEHRPDETLPESRQPRLHLPATASTRRSAPGKRNDARRNSPTTASPAITQRAWSTATTTWPPRSSSSRCSTTR